MEQDCVLLLKNATPHRYTHKYRDPDSNEMVSIFFEPFSTAELCSGTIDFCSQVRLQNTEIPDSDDSKLSSNPIQFIWDGVVPNVDDYKKANDEREAAIKAAAQSSIEEAQDEAGGKLLGKKAKMRVGTSAEDAQELVG